MTNILTNGFAHDADDKKAVDSTPLFFNGCYFAAIGESEERQAFIKGVIEMLPRDQEELEWTEAALQDEDRYQKWSQVAMWFDGLLVVALAGMIVFHFWWQTTP